MLKLSETDAWPERIVVIGARGFLGGAIARRLRREDAPVIGVSRAEVDLLAEGAAEELAALLSPGDAVVAASAIAPVKSPEMLIDNINLATCLANAFARRPIKYLLNIGSDAVFADCDAPLTEESCKAPASLHGVMHLTRELMLDEAAPKVATLRPTLVYGAGDPHNGYGPNRFRRQVAAGEPVPLFGAGEERRDHVWVEDVANLAARMIRHRAEGSLNAASGEVISFQSIALALGGAIQETPRQGPMPHNGYRPFDISAIRAAFPDFSPTPVREGLRRAWTLEEAD